MLYHQTCLNCKKTFTIKAIDDVLFCSDECQTTYYENVVGEVAKKLGIDIPIENRWEILDL